MTKMNLLPISQIQPSVADQDKSIQWPDAERPRHLIILIPADSDCAAVTRRICALAKETNSCVQLLALYKDSSEELALRRELVTASALIHDARVCVEIMIEKGTDWVEAVKHNYQTGDAIVCLSEQSVGLRRKPLSQILESNFNAPVYVLSDHQAPRPASGVVSQAAAWLGLVGIIVGFFTIQVKITQFTSGGFQTLLLLLMLLPEFWLIKLWNSLFF